MKNTDQQPRSSQISPKNRTPCLGNTRKILWCVSTLHGQLDRRVKNSQSGAGGFDGRRDAHGRAAPSQYRATVWRGPIMLDTIKEIWDCTFGQANLRDYQGSRVLSVWLLLRRKKPRENHIKKWEKHPVLKGQIYLALNVSNRIF